MAVLFRQPFVFMEPPTDLPEYTPPQVEPALPGEGAGRWFPLPPYPESPRRVPPGYRPLFPRCYRVSDYAAPTPRNPKTIGGMNASMPPTDSVLRDLFGRNAPDEAKRLTTVFLEDSSLNLYQVFGVRYISPESVLASESLYAKAQEMVVSYPTLEFPINALMVIFIFDPASAPAASLDEDLMNLCITT